MIDAPLAQHVCMLSQLVTCLESMSHFTVQRSTNVLERMSYNVSFKLKAVEYAQKKIKEAAAREIGVYSKWCKQKLLANLKKKGASLRKRQCGAEGKAVDVDLENALLSWILELHSCNIHVSR